ncbi:alkyl sulfatase [Geminocystis sp. NIES-3709]|nr:alkyl sulfatase [Geminocystis sp. NIES-3709]
MEIVNKLVYAEPQNQAAKDLLADAFEQFGYQQESNSVRNSYLAAAYELRSGIPTGKSAKSSGPDVIRAMPTNLWLDFLGIRLDSKKAEGLKFTVNLITPDNDEKYVVELSNSTLTNIKGFQAPNPDLTITINRTDLEAVMMGAATLDQQITSGKAKLVGDRRPYDQLKNILVQFTPDFEMMPGTKPVKLAIPNPNPFEQEPLGDTTGG